MAVTKNEQGTWDYECVGRPGCGDAGVGFRSTGWPRKADAEARGKEHEAQPHMPGEGDGTHEPMRDLDTFRAARGLNPDLTPVDTTQDA